jgi:hypothetical protein
LRTVNFFEFLLYKDRQFLFPLVSLGPLLLLLLLLLEYLVDGLFVGYVYVVENDVVVHCLFLVFRALKVIPSVIYTREFDVLERNRRHVDVEGLLFGLTFFKYYISNSDLVSF